LTMVNFCKPTNLPKHF